MVWHDWIRSTKVGQTTIIKVPIFCVVLFLTHPVLKAVPLWRGLVKDLSLHGQHQLAEEVVPAKHVAVPHCQPETTTLYLGQGHLELKYERKGG
jgi:hypothetical protein